MSLGFLGDAYWIIRHLASHFFFLLEVVSKPQIRLKSKAQADEKAKSKCLK
jgi:hypothetical protein